jgi:hypothetical protein
MGHLFLTSGALGTHEISYSGKSSVPHNWTGGGLETYTPIWRLHGANGLLYFVGVDGKVYLPDQLPVLPGTTIIANE